MASLYTKTRSSTKTTKDLMQNYLTPTTKATSTLPKTTNTVSTLPKTTTSSTAIPSATTRTVLPTTAKTSTLPKTTVPSTTTKTVLPTTGVSTLPKTTTTSGITPLVGSQTSSTTKSPSTNSTANLLLERYGNANTNSQSSLLVGANKSSSTENTKNLLLDKYTPSTTVGAISGATTKLPTVPTPTTPNTSVQLSPNLQNSLTGKNSVLDAQPSVKMPGMEQYFNDSVIHKQEATKPSTGGTTNEGVITNPSQNVDNSTFNNIKPSSPTTTTTTPSAPEPERTLPKVEEKPKEETPAEAVKPEVKPIVPQNTPQSTPQNTPTNGTTSGSVNNSTPQTNGSTTPSQEPTNYTMDEYLKQSYDESQANATNRYNSYNQQAMDNYLKAGESLKQNLSQSRQEAYVNNELLMKYLPEELKRQGLSNLGVSQSAYLNANNSYANTLNQLQQGYLQNKSELDTNFNNAQLERDMSYEDTMNQIRQNYITSKIAQLEKADDRAYQQGLLEDERAYQDKLTQDDRAYNDSVIDKQFEQQKEMFNMEKSQANYDALIASAETILDNARVDGDWQFGLDFVEQNKDILGEKYYNMYKAMFGTLLQEESGSTDQTQNSATSTQGGTSTQGSANTQGGTSTSGSQSNGSNSTQTVSVGGKNYSLDEAVDNPATYGDKRLATQINQHALSRGYLPEFMEAYNGKVFVGDNGSYTVYNGKIYKISAM